MVFLYTLSLSLHQMDDGPVITRFFFSTCTHRLSFMNPSKIAPLRQHRLGPTAPWVRGRGRTPAVSAAAGARRAGSAAAAFPPPSSGRPNRISLRLSHRDPHGFPLPWTTPPVGRSSRPSASPMSSTWVPRLVLFGSDSCAFLDDLGLTLMFISFHCCGVNPGLGHWFYLCNKFATLV